MENQKQALSNNLGEDTVKSKKHVVWKVVGIIFLVAIVLVGGLSLYIYEDYKTCRHNVMTDYVPSGCSNFFQFFAWFLGSHPERYWGENIVYTAKPVIYLYPEQIENISVGLDYQGEIFALYPEYNIENGWQVVANPDGTIFDNGKEYSYLFWEGNDEGIKSYDWTKGFIVRGSEVREFLQEKLAEIGLVPKEYNEFIVYWYPKLQDNEYNLIRFADAENFGLGDEYSNFAELIISPEPDSLLRVFMVYKSLSESEVRTLQTTIIPQTFPKFERNGFVVVEWGGGER